MAGPAGRFVRIPDDVLVPDLAGWRVTTLAELPDAPHIETRPDWICEVLSPTTEKTDRAIKLPIYARAGVGHAWLVNPTLRTLEVLRLEQGRWLSLGTHRDEERVRAEPFDAIVLELGVLWAGRSR